MNNQSKFSFDFFQRNGDCNRCKRGDMSVSTSQTGSDRGSSQGSTKTRTGASSIFNCEEAVISFRNDHLNPNVILFSAIASLPFFAAMLAGYSLLEGVFNFRKIRRSWVQ